MLFSHMHWSDVLKAALSLFLILTGFGLAYLFLRMAGVFTRLGSSVTRVTDEIVPILTRAQTTMDGVNREIDRVDEIMVTAVNGAKGAERALQTVSSAATAPVRILSGVAAGVKEGFATFVARRSAEAKNGPASGGSGSDEAKKAANEAAATTTESATQSSASTETAS